MSGVAKGRGWRGRYTPYNRGRGYLGKGGYWRGRGGGNVGNKTSNNNAKNCSSQSSLIQTSMYDVPSPYKGWKLYFPEEVYSETSPVVVRVKTFEKYFKTWKAQFNLSDIESKNWFSVDFKDLLADQGVLDNIPEFTKEVRQSPETMLHCLGLAMHQIISEQNGDSEVNQNRGRYNHLDPLSSQASSIAGSQGQTQVKSSQDSYVIPLVYARLSNFDPITPLKHLKANYYGKFVAVKGTVVRVSNIKPLCTQMVFQCSTCSHLQVVKLPDGKFQPPTQCTLGGCRSKAFNPKRSHPQTITIDWQTIRIQEIMNDDQRESGRIPRTVDCELTNDLVDSCVPGDSITAAGVVKVLSTSDEKHKRQKDKCMFLLYIHANSITNTKGGSKNTGEAQTGISIDFTMKDLYAIEEIQAQEDLFKLLVASVCPAIYGHEMVKAGLVLGLFGGTHKYVNDKNRIPVRGDPHILVVGDPGLGKSQMLQAMSNIAPRSVYVCGNTTTTSGLTVTLTKEGGGSGDYALEAGALVLADQGCCCIDEFDKMGTQHQALLEAMEQQSISIAKAGIVCSLPARTSILAAANPVGGHYNRAKTVSENLRMGGALLSRFDLVFILLDKPDEEMDALLSDHVMAMHAGRKPGTGDTPRSLNDSMLTQDEIDARRQWQAQKPLSERLKVQSGEALDLIPAQLLRKYVAYARRYVHPKITPESAQILQQFYLELRKQHQTKDCTPITTRQLESLIRLTEARARLELREECTVQDASDVIELMKYSMLDTYSDQFGFLDFSRSQHGSGMSTKSAAKKFVAVLQRQYERNFNALFTAQDMRELMQHSGIQVKDFEGFVSTLNNQGYLLKKGPRLYQLQTAGY